MVRYSIQPRDQRFVKGYEFLSFAEILANTLVKI